MVLTPNRAVLEVSSLSGGTSPVSESLGNRCQLPVGSGSVHPSPIATVSPGTLSTKAPRTGHGLPMKGETLPGVKAAREAENLECVGGLRNPNLAVSRSSRLRKTGKKIRSILENLMMTDVGAEALNAVKNIGNDKYKGIPMALLTKAQNAFQIALSTPDEKDVGMNRSDYQSHLWEALLKDAGDPEVDVPSWMREGCPTGMPGSDIQARGIFPPAQKATAAVEQSRMFGAMAEGKVWREADHSNYKSFYAECSAHAKAEVERLADREFIQEFPDWAKLTASWPDATANKVALILKQRTDKSWKRRFVVDLLRSGYNGDADIPERIVLPRMDDFVAGILDLLEANTFSENMAEDCNLELVAMDFSDAFYTLWLSEKDRGRLAFRTPEGWAAFKRLCFGMAGAPLIWGRVAAAACRLAQAIFSPTELRIQCFVDDPAIVVRGNARTRSHLLGMLILFWSVLGLKLSFGKGTRGSSVPWIGATVSVSNREWQPRCGKAVSIPGVLVQLQEEKFKEVCKNVDTLHLAKGTVNLKLVRTVAGQLSWISGLFTWIKSFNSCLWRALTAHVEESRKAVVSSNRRRQKRPTDLFFTVRISQAVRWTRMLLHGLIRTPDGTAFKVQRWHSLAHRKAAFSHTIRTDASPYGFGAILFDGQWPVAWCAAKWEAADLDILKAEPGNPAWQAEWELFAIFIALDLWLPRLRGTAAGVLQSDATAALFASRREAGRTPAINALCAEIALRVEVAAIQLRHEHYAAVLNFEADALSRLSRGAAMPSRLAHVERQPVPARSFSSFWAWPRELREAKQSAPAMAAIGRGA